MTVGQNVSFVHEGAGYRKYGVILAIDGDDITVQVGDRIYHVSAMFDEVEAE